MGNSKKHILIVAGEASGDVHAAHLVSHIKKVNPEIHFSGVGGAEMQKSGVELYQDITGLAVVGFVEVLKNYSDIKKIFYMVIKKAKEHNVDAVILVDYPGFNLRLAKKLKRLGITVIYYISPQVWAWKKNRIKLIQRFTDRMIVLFPFEKEFYARHGLNVSCAGHPLLDRIQAFDKPANILSSLGLKESKTTIGILPGSREKEVEKMLPIMLLAANLLYKKDPQLQFVVVKAPTVKGDFLKNMLKGSALPLAVAEGHAYEGISASDFCMVTSGTATLETALFEKPMVVVYKTSLLSWLLAKLVVKISCIGMVNVLAGKKIVPECIQLGANPKRIAQEIAGIYRDNSRITAIKSELSRVKSSLGEPGADTRAAQEVLRVLAKE